MDTEELVKKLNGVTTDCYAEIESEILKIYITSDEGDNVIFSINITADNIFRGITEDLEKLDVKSEGSKIRYSDLYGSAGSNVNFVNQIANDIFAVRTYERGVEDETLSCGTGATAVAIAMHQTGKTKNNTIAIKVQGGKLKVNFEENNGNYTKVFLIGPATFVFEGKIKI